MRFKEILREYSREKTANVFGKKLIAALLADRGRSYGSGESHAILSDLINRIVQKQKIGSPLDAEQTDLTAKQILHAIEQGDPTPNKEYVQWLAKCYSNEGIKLEDIVSKGADWLKTYAQLKVKRLLPPNVTNIMNLKFEQLPAVVLDDELVRKLQSAEDKIADKGEATTVFENGAVRIIVPHDETSARYYGQGTRWCTAARENNMYNQYARGGDLYILLPKQPKHDGEKYQLHFSSGQFMDENDDSVDSIVELLDMRFGNLIEFFRQHEPILNDWLIFSPDEVLQPLLDKIIIAVEEHLWEMANEWETNDDYWWEYLQSEGYVYPEGHDEEGGIDWDKVAEAGLSYTNWDYEAKGFIRNINDAVDLAPSHVRELASKMGSEHGDYTQDISSLDRIIIYSIEESLGRRESDGGIIKWIEDHLYIKRVGGKGAWDVALLYTQQDGTRKEYAIRSR